MTVRCLKSIEITVCVTLMLNTPALFYMKEGSFIFSFFSLKRRC